LANESEERFSFFKRSIWEKWEKNEQLDKVLVFCSSYFEFLKLRSFFQKEDASILGVSEYSEKSKIQSRVASFMSRKCAFLLFSERAYFFEKCLIKNMNHIVFYSLPENEYILTELLENLNKKQNVPKVVSVFS
jgi:U3 small nucleolar RNA-associated protein 25